MVGATIPVGATLAAVFFGFMWNLQNQLSFADKLPSEKPYIIMLTAKAAEADKIAGLDIGAETPEEIALANAGVDEEALLLRGALARSVTMTTSPSSRVSK